jgi:hypothetical protein
MNTRSPLKNSLLAFLTFRDLPSADILAATIEALIEERIKAREEALRAGLSHPFGDPWVTAPAKRYVPPTEGWTQAATTPSRSLCNHDLFASDNTLVLQSRTVTCEHCERSFKL